MSSFIRKIVVCAAPACFLLLKLCVELQFSRAVRSDAEKVPRPPFQTDSAVAQAGEKPLLFPCDAIRCDAHGTERRKFETTSRRVAEMTQTYIHTPIEVRGRMTYLCTYVPIKM